MSPLNRHITINIENASRRWKSTAAKRNAICVLVWVCGRWFLSVADNWYTNFTFHSGTPQKLYHQLTNMITVDFEQNFFVFARGIFSMFSKTLHSIWTWKSCAHYSLLIVIKQGKTVVDNARRNERFWPIGYLKK